MTTTKARAAAGARGGSVSSAESPAKAAALARLHASRKGVPVHPVPPPELSEIRRLIRLGTRKWGRQLNQCSVSEAARQVGIHQRTMRRWLAGKARPAADHHAAIIATASHLRSLLDS